MYKDKFYIMHSRDFLQKYDDISHPVMRYKLERI